MGWPTPQDYNEAIQNPGTCFADPGLRAGEPALTPLGLPKPVSGAFASVYELQSGGRHWAVRCFLREVADQQARYAAVCAHLRRAKPPCMVDFDFLERGIQVRGRWYPILKMEWIDGKTLNSYIEDHLDEPHVLRMLTRHWIDLVASLRRAGIAHGDLQHGNILVSQGRLRLIDYDAMFVPALSGQHCPEEGHRNFQHPGRTGQDFGPDLDNFSSWVIFHSLLALMVRPGLWQGLGGGDERLLFRREDFVAPDRSPAFRLLRDAGCPRLQMIAMHFRALLAQPIGQIPPLGDIAPGPASTSSSSSSPALARAAGSRASSVSLPVWLADHVQPDVPAASAPAPASSSASAPAPSRRPGGTLGIGADWLFEHLAGAGASAPGWGEGRYLHERVALASAVMACASAIYPALAAWPALLVPETLLAVAFGWLAHRFRSSPPAVARRAAMGRVASSRRAVRQTERAIAGIARERDRLDRPSAPQRRRRRRLERRRDAALAALQAQLYRTLAMLEGQRQELDLAEGRALVEVEGASQKHLDRLYAIRTLIGQAEPDFIWRILGRERSRGAAPSMPQVAAEINNEIKAVIEGRRKDSRAVREQFEAMRRALDEHEQAVKLEHARAAEAASARFLAEMARVSEEIQALRGPMAEASRKLDERLNERERALVGQELDLFQARIESSAYRAITFRRFLARVVWPRIPSGRPPARPLAAEDDPRASGVREVAGGR